jgi:hypothetical protein
MGSGKGHGKQTVRLDEPLGVVVVVAAAEVLKCKKGGENSVI